MKVSLRDVHDVCGCESPPPPQLLNGWTNFYRNSYIGNWAHVNGPVSQSPENPPKRTFCVQFCNKLCFVLSWHPHCNLPSWIAIPCLLSLTVCYAVMYCLKLLTPVLRYGAIWAPRTPTGGVPGSETGIQGNILVTLGVPLFPTFIYTVCILTYFRTYLTLGRCPKVYLWSSVTRRGSTYFGFRRVRRQGTGTVLFYGPLSVGFRLLCNSYDVCRLSGIA
jgi:hypothetical protein